MLAAKIVVYDSLIKLRARCSEYESEQRVALALAQKLFDEQNAMLLRTDAQGQPRDFEQLLLPGCESRCCQLLTERSEMGSWYVFLAEYNQVQASTVLFQLQLKSVFSQLVGKSLPVAQMAEVLNERIYRTWGGLVRCAAACLEYDFEKSRICYWMGGMPDVLHVSSSLTRLDLARGKDQGGLGTLPPKLFSSQNAGQIKLSRGEQFVVHTLSLIASTSGLQASDAPMGQSQLLQFLSQTGKNDLAGFAKFHADVVGGQGLKDAILVRFQRP